MNGLVYFRVERVSTGEGDYSKWLGPDWKPEWTGAGTIVSNHTSFIDICIMIVTFWPAFLAKVSLKKIYVVGDIATAMGSFYIERNGTKEEKIAVCKAI